MLISQRLIFIVGLLWGAVAGTALTALYLGTPGVGHINGSYFIALLIVVGIPWMLLYGIWWAIVGANPNGQADRR